jgi:hypothetical protein
MSHLTWDEVYARQTKRAHLVGERLDALGLKPGDHVLEIGEGPWLHKPDPRRAGRQRRCGRPLGGSFELPGAPPGGTRDLAHSANCRRCRNVGAGGSSPESALVTMVLHHADDPAGILRAVSGGAGRGVG